MLAGSFAQAACCYAHSGVVGGFMEILASYALLSWHTFTLINSGLSVSPGSLPLWPFSVPTTKKRKNIKQIYENKSLSPNKVYDFYIFYQ